MTYEKILIITVLLLYSLGTMGIFIGALSKRRKIREAANWFTLAGFALHTLVALYALMSHSFETLSSSYFMQFFAWCIIFLYICAWLWLRLRILALTAAPLALLLCALAMRSSAQPVILPSEWSGLFFTLHIAAFFASGALLTLAFGAALLFMYLDRSLKRKVSAGAFESDFPSLSAFDNVNKIAVLVGFPLYTLGMMSGFVWVPIFATALESPKAILSLLGWVLYALLFYQRTALGYRGRKTAVMAIGVFIVSALSLAVDYVLTHHSTLYLP